jgi:hypothetical protein
MAAKCDSMAQHDRWRAMEHLQGGPKFDSVFRALPDTDQIDYAIYGLTRVGPHRTEDARRIATRGQSIVPLLLARLRRTTDDLERNALFYTFSEIACVHPEMRGNRPLADTLRLIAAGIEEPRYRRSALWHVAMFDTTRGGCHSGTPPPPEYVP